MSIPMLIEISVAAFIAGVILAKLSRIEALIKRDKEECDGELMKACLLALSHLQRDPKPEKLKELAIFIIRDALKNAGMRADQIRRATAATKAQEEAR